MTEDVLCLPLRVDSPIATSYILSVMQHLFAKLMVIVVPALMPALLLIEAVKVLFYA